MAVKPIPDEYHSLQPYLIVDGAPSLMEFLKATFDAEDLGSMPTPEGKIGHAEMRVGDTVVMLADASTAEGVSGAMPSTVVAYVEDCDKIYQRAIAAGATSLREPKDMFTATEAPASSTRSATTGGSTRTSRTYPRKR
jgi:PhnB protein